MANTELIGRGMVTVILDGNNDYVTPERFVISSVYWLNKNTTDNLILREYDPEKSKSVLPFITLTNPIVSTIGFLPAKVSIRYMVDVTSSTTIEENILTFLGTWG
jgi:hypothetical protein